VVKRTAKIASRTSGNQMCFHKGQIRSQNCSTHMGAGGPPRGTSQPCLLRAQARAAGGAHLGPGPTCALHGRLPPLRCTPSPAQHPRGVRAGHPPPCCTGSAQQTAAPLLYGPFLVVYGSFSV